MGKKVAPTEKSSLVDKPKPEEDLGEPTPYDANFKGPIADRGCTDVLCCLLFVICFLGMIAVAALAFARGDPVKLLYPTDTDGNICGSGDYADKPNLVFFDMTVCARMGVAVLTTGCPTPQVCVKACPAGNFHWLEAKVPGVSQSTVRQKMICKYTTNSLTSSKVCSAACPTETFTWLQTKKNSSYIDKMICRRGINPRTNARSITDLVADEDCAAYYVQSTSIVGRCVPSIFATILNKTLSLSADDGTAIVNKLNETVTGTELEEGMKYLAVFLSAGEYGMQIYQDVRAAWWMILVGLGIGMLISFIWIIIMRWITCPMVWISIIIFLGLFGFATYYCIAKYLSLRNNEDAQLSGSLAFTTDLSYYTNLAVTWLVFGCATGIIFLISFIMIIFLRKRIQIAISLIKESSKAVGSMVFTLFYPLIPFLMQIILFGFWGASAVYLSSMGTQTFGAFNKTETNVTVNETDANGVMQTVTKVQETINDITGQIDCSLIVGNSSVTTNLQGFCNFVKYGGDEYTIYLQFFQLFMLFWCMNFIVAFGQMTLAGAFASYYWAFNKPKDIPVFPLAGSTYRSLRYHLGTLAFGSLLVALVQIARVALEYLDSKLKGKENAPAKFFLACLKCCLWCLEKFIKFLNKNAYIMTAIYGKNFCTSAKNAFFLILRNIVRVAVVDKVTDWVLLLSKLFVTGAIGTLGYLFFSGEATTLAMSLSTTVGTTLTAYTPALNFYLVPVIIICLGTYMIASAFFSVYSMAVDTLFLCFLEDLERNDGSETKPYYMSKDLMGILGKKNDKPKDD